MWKFIVALVSILRISEVTAQSNLLNADELDSVFVCSFKCDNSFSSIRTNCLKTAIRDNPIPVWQVNPYEEFDLIISTLNKQRNNPFQLRYVFRECETICNAASATIDTLEYIFYNPHFMNSIKSLNAKLKWGVRAIIAHEIGHHILGHTLPKSGRIQPEENRRNELRADYFGAFVIKRFPGATLEDALEGLNSLDEKSYLPKTQAEEQRSMYPTLERRKEAVRQGFRDDMDGAIQIAMFRNIDSVAAVAYARFGGASVIFRTFDKQIAFNNLKEAKEFLGKLKNENLSAVQKSLLSKAEVQLNRLTDKSDVSILEDDIPKINLEEEEIKELEKLYNKYKNSFTVEDKIKAKEIFDRINKLKERKKGY
ncbi:MAG: hypothetical protein EOP48_01880 [Sphingobacteriales bacterium]|nr:MAG: hypothetical protein EOP48_01880 [Sphingobacteriales bacterium]